MMGKHRQRRTQALGTATQHHVHMRRGVDPSPGSAKGMRWDGSRTVLVAKCVDC